MRNESIGLAFGVADGVECMAVQRLIHRIFGHLLYHTGRGDILDPGLFSPNPLRRTGQASRNPIPRPGLQYTYPGQIIPTECLDTAFTVCRKLSMLKGVCIRDCLSTSITLTCMLIIYLSIACPMTLNNAFPATEYDGMLCPSSESLSLNTSIIATTWETLNCMS